MTLNALGLDLYLYTSWFFGSIGWVC